ncbi:GNAT superfamily N-acetyltransferase [Pseudomonas moraviensis]|uniref:GNAT family N-acetyltransferase n=1 Tax=Pseudomonas moraviensis TaxID=321662 RepID=UPI003D1A190A
MITINRHATPVTPMICASILELVGENVTSLSMLRPPKVHPLFEGYKALLVEEIRTYITRQDLPQIEVITASSDDGSIVGFLLFGLVETDVLECNIYYTAVKKQFRRQGIMSQMMKVVLQISPALGLSCDIAMVPIYERYGFRPVAARDAQIVMFIADPKGITPVVSVEDLKRLDAVDIAFRRAAQTSGPHEVRRADKVLKSDLAARQTKARQFMKANG